MPSVVDISSRKVVVGQAVPDAKRVKRANNSFVRHSLTYFAAKEHTDAGTALRFFWPTKSQLPPANVAAVNELGDRSDRFVPVFLFAEPR